VFYFLFIPQGWMALEDRFNFPKDLSIEPSKPPPPSQSQLISDGAEIEQPIEQYGIAGRIWSALARLGLFKDANMGD
jgi:hypothetical protein